VANQLVRFLLGLYVSAPIRELPVALDVSLSVLPHERVRRWKLLQAVERAERMRNVLKVKVRVDRIEIRASLHFRILENGFCPRAEPEFPATLGVEERLLADAVT